MSRSFAYCGEPSHPDRHLDVYMPIENGSHNVLLFIHGGAWTSNHRSQFAFIGEAMAEKYNIVTVIAGYRLSSKSESNGPDDWHPMHLKDVAASVEWTANAPRDLLGFAPSAIYLAGHSCGAQLAALLVLQPGWLQPATLQLIHGFVGIEGIYSIPNLAKRFPTYIQWFIQYAFSADTQKWLEASPTHIDIHTTLPLHPQFRVLLVHSPDDELVDIDQLVDFRNKLLDANVRVDSFTQINGKHDDVLKLDQLHNIIAEFISH